MRDKAGRARRELKTLELRYHKLIRLMHSQFPPHIIERLKVAAQSTSVLDLAAMSAFSGMRRIGPIARLIEEMLLLTPWNLTKECLEVTNVSFGIDPHWLNLFFRNKVDNSASMGLAIHQGVVVKESV